MKITPFMRASITFLCQTVCVFAAFSQPQVSLVPGQSSLLITGTSSLHNWEEKAEKFDVTLQLKTAGKELTGIEKAVFICKSSSVTSENSIMTGKTHDALLVGKYPEITFKMVSVENLTSQNGAFSGTLTGDISLAGVTRHINISFTGNLAGNRISIKGSKLLNLSDFKIKPPTAMLGTLKTGDQVTVSFVLQFQTG
jgi:polyisoprenoid-binding protein YceI